MGIAQPLLRWPLARAEACIMVKQTLDPQTCDDQNFQYVKFGVASFGSNMVTKSALMLAAALVGAQLATSPAAADPRTRLPDGRWRVQVEGQGPHVFCYFSATRIGEVRGGKPLLGNEIKYKLTVSRGGHLVASGRTQDDYGAVRGKVARNLASGSFDVPSRNCRGQWQAERIGA